jgi:hypothetical protein
MCSKHCTQRVVACDELEAHLSFTIKYHRGTKLVDLFSGCAGADWGNSVMNHQRKTTMAQTASDILPTFLYGNTIIWVSMDMDKQAQYGFLKNMTSIQLGSYIMGELSVYTQQQSAKHSL